jgi:hypothetical protein
MSLAHLLVRRWKINAGGLKPCARTSMDGPYTYIHTALLVANVRLDLQVASLLAGSAERTVPSSSKGSTAGAQHAAAAFDCPSATASGGLTAPTALVLIFMNRRSKCTMNGAAESIAAAQQAAREARTAIRQTWLTSPLVSADLSSSKPLLYRFVVGTHGVTLEEVGSWPLLFNHQTIKRANNKTTNKQRLPLLGLALAFTYSGAVWQCLRTVRLALALAPLDATGRALLCGSRSPVGVLNQVAARPTNQR